MGMLINPYTPNGGGGGDPYYSSVKLLIPANGTDGATTTSDFSSSPATLTFAGATALSTTRAKFGSASLKNGTGAVGDRLQTNRAQGITTGAFTLEAHIRPTAAQTGRIVSSQDLISSNPVITWRVNSGGSMTAILRNSAGAGTLVLTSGTSPVSMSDTAWYHSAFTRDGSNNVNIWHEGSSIASSTSSTSPAGAPAYNIGSYWGGSGTAQEPFAGYLDNIRVTEGVCRYTASFTPPTAEYPTST